MSWSLNAASPEIAPSRADLVEERLAAVERLARTAPPRAEHVRDLAAVLVELGVDAAHLLDDDVGQMREEQGLEADPVAVLDRAPHDAAEDVAASLVGRRDAVADEERHAAAVVGEDAMRFRGGLVRSPRRRRSPPRSSCMIVW